ncbi:MAG: HlyD family efflux transporter periplasmic adaptor subunit [Saprospiraceae bacterium]|nr:HlyD family efflux transporter periplasmic adaptor subunit [Saprospiraceae bacterium]
MKKTTLLLCALTLWGCKPEENTSDAYGNFEAREILVSSESAGKILRLDVEEGQSLKAGEIVGVIDTTALHLRKLQLLASIRTVQGKTQDVQPQINVLEEQRRNLLRERDRLKALVQEHAATQKQLDDMEGQLLVVERQIASARAQNRNLNTGILGETDPLRVQIEQIEDQIARCYIVNPVDGTVLLQLAEAHEVTAPGKPLYKIADLDQMTLRVYVGGDQLPNVKVGEAVTVLVDADEKSNRTLTGTVSWVSPKAEFTPRIVQTKEQRVNLVYAVKVLVKNDGTLKIGMPGEVRW